MKNRTIYKLTNFNISDPILGYYEGCFDNCYIVLHPFYKKVFDKNYDYKKKYEYTFPLIETITWSEVMKTTGIKSLQKLHVTICCMSEDEAKGRAVWEEWQRLEEYSKSYNIEIPDFNQDIIPCDIILAFIKFLLDCGYGRIITSDFLNGRENIQEISILNENLYIDAVRLEHKGFIASPDLKYCLQLPYFDSAHSLLLTNGADITSAVSLMKLEGFYADRHTTNTW